MFKEKLKIYESGSYAFLPGDKLSKKNNAPDSYGVYLFFALKADKSELVYIGKSGTISQNGEFSKQALKQRLLNKQDGMKRQDFFDSRIEKEQLDGIKVEWYVTVDKGKIVLPGYVEAVLLQTFYTAFGKLPKWNEKF